jgi:hypothetical protein
MAMESAYDERLFGMRMRRSAIAGLVLMMAAGMLVPFLCCESSATTLSVRADDRCPLSGSDCESAPCAGSNQVTASPAPVAFIKFVAVAVTVPAVTIPVESETHPRLIVSTTDLWRRAAPVPLRI